VKITRQQVTDFLAKRETASPEDRLIEVTNGILVDFLGEAWVESFVYGDAGEPFFRIRSTDPLDRLKHHDRITGLAEMLFNLQDVPGLATRLEDLKSGNLESTFFELEAGMFLRLCGLDFEYRNRSGTRGSDYELDAVLTQGTRVCCEAKCKLESTLPSERSVADAIRTARAQLPKERAGIVFLKIPEAWHDLPTLRAMMRAGVTKGWSGSGRISAVIVIWERWLMHASGGRRDSKYLPYVNPRSRAQISTLEEDLTPNRTAKRWFSVTDAVGGVAKWHGSTRGRAERP
jgi:hypothetical protein